MRIMEIVTTELALDKMKCEENLEAIINSKEDTTIKVIKIKQVLKSIVLTDNMIDTWLKYMTTGESDNNK